MNLGLNTSITRQENKFKFILLETFKKNYSAPLPSPYICNPGPGEFRVIDTQNRLSVSNGKRRSTGNTVLGDPLMYYPYSLTRTNGLVFLASHTSIDNNTGRLRYNFHGTNGVDVNSNGHSWIFGHGANVLICSTRLQDFDVGIVLCEDIIWQNDVEYRVGIILGEAGARYIIKSYPQFPQWTVFGVDNWSRWNPVYFTISSQIDNRNWRADTDWVAVANLKDNGYTTWDNNGPHTNSSAGLQEQGKQFVHTKKCFVEFVIDSPPITGSMKLHFRKIDPNNYWELEILTDQKTYKFNRITNGFSENLVTQDVFVFLPRYNPVLPFTNNRSMILIIRDTWVSALFSSSRMDTLQPLTFDGDTFEIFDLGGGSIRDIVIRDMELSGDALQGIERMENAILSQN